MSSGLRCCDAAALSCCGVPGLSRSSRRRGPRPVRWNDCRERHRVHRGWSGKEALTANLEQFVAPMLNLSDDELAEVLRSMFGPAVSGELGDYAVACVRHSVRQGIVGWRDDTLTQARPWGLDLDRINVPVSIWHGVGDRNVGVEHAVWLSEHIPGAQLNVVAGEYHISLITRVDTVLQDLLERAGLSM
jgi:pimeloyl-ACP methyl ester carboxylesterase